MNLKWTYLSGLEEAGIMYKTFSMAIDAGQEEEIFTPELSNSLATTVGILQWSKTVAPTGQTQ